MTKRRDVLKGAAAGGIGAVMAGSAGAQSAVSASLKRPEVLFFDSNESMLDLGGMKPEVTAAFEGRDDLMALWFSTMISHSLVDTVTSNYHNFGEIGAACMQMVAEGHGIKLDKKKADKAFAAMKTIPVWPDVPPSLQKFRDAGIRLFTLTNSPATVIGSQVKHNNLGKYFEGQLTVEGLNVYKPHTRVYHWAANTVGVPIGNCMLVAAHGWDVTGATLAGMRAAFMQRPGKTLYPLGPTTEIIAKDMAGVADQLMALPE